MGLFDFLFGNSSASESENRLLPKSNETWVVLQAYGNYVSYDASRLEINKADGIVGFITMFAEGPEDNILYMQHRSYCPRRNKLTIDEWGTYERLAAAGKKSSFWADREEKEHNWNYESIDIPSDVNLCFLELSMHLLAEDYPSMPAKETLREFSRFENRDGINIVSLVKDSVKFQTNGNICCQFVDEVEHFGGVPQNKVTVALYDVELIKNKDGYSVLINSVARYLEGKCFYYALPDATTQLNWGSPYDLGDAYELAEKEFCGLVASRLQMAKEFMPENRTELIPEDLFMSFDDEAGIEEIFSRIIGLESVKKLFRNQFNLMRADKQRQSLGIDNKINVTRHMVFTGNPGTGKTTMARIVASVFKSMGILKTGQLIETDRSELVGEYIGQTAPKTTAVFKKAIGGVLFIDEAYSLYSMKGSNDYGKEAINTILKLMEDHKDDTIVILAGYTKEMSELLNMNPGLKSRFPMHIEFPDYSPKELMCIAKRFLVKKGYSLAQGTEAKLEQELGIRQRRSGTNAGNGRLARNYIDEILANQAARLNTNAGATKEDWLTICPEDLPSSGQQNADFDLEKELAKVIGLENVKEYLLDLQANIRMEQIKRKRGLAKETDGPALHFVFAGNPGTGKTTMARIMAKSLYNIGVIPSEHLVEVSRKDLVAGYVGQTAIKTEEAFKSAQGGVLFIDEAYALSSGNDASDFGREAIDTLVKLVEDDRNTVVILAGYTDKMEEFLDVNPGLSSRFPDFIEFPDYEVSELLTIMQGMYTAENYVVDEAAKTILAEILQTEKSKPNFGNARVARNYVEKSIRRQKRRISKCFDEKMSDAEFMLIKAEDI